MLQSLLHCRLPPTSLLQDDLLAKLPTGCILAVALQYGLTETQAAYKQRGACLDARSTMGWSDENENRWKETLNGTRYGFIQWFA